VAFFVFFAAATGAGIVAADFFFCAMDGLLWSCGSLSPVQAHLLWARCFYFDFRAFTPHQLKLKG